MVMPNICESMETAAGHPSGTKNSKMPSIVLGNLWSTDLQYIRLHKAGITMHGRQAQL
jgi:hypothetical protein